MSGSDWDALSLLPPAELEGVLAGLSAGEQAGLRWNWAVQARPEQLAPAGDWRVWLVLAGRGFGKTRAGAEWVRAIAQRDGAARIALVGASPEQVRGVMVEGESGLLAIAPPGERPVWRPSLGMLRWPSGAEARVFGASAPERLRGPQFSHGWADEIAKWPRGEDAWDNLMLALRLGDAPRVMATTTPRPVSLIRRLVAQGEVVVTLGRTADNAAHLAPAFLEAVTRDYGGTRLGRQELDGELIEELDGALWTRAIIEACRAAAGEMPRLRGALRRVVIGVDPPAGVDGDACGIVAVGLDAGGRGMVIEDASVAGLRPEGWARAVAEAAARWGADRVIAEANNGGAMVESVLRAADGALPVKLVHASRGKSARAEPVAALYETGRLVHAGAFPALEDQMCGMMTGGGYEGPGRSPDRADALVWAVSALMLARGAGEVRIRRI
ncbi:terminase family protein [Sphingobium sp. H39-3-25]|uniref:DNA-packaging protein n=1 Tax=Sphingobium arseniciresistens TaxID=3030834 RepID=UPI0023B95E3D|nr:terminase family protein [Sphingobium arseniciresistens]